MAKYIDAEKLRAEIKWQKHELELSIQSQGDYGQSCHIVAYDNILSLINSLQQEQPDFPTTDEQVKEFLATHPKIKVPEKYKNPDWLFKKQEQPEVDFKIEERKWVHDAVDNIFPEDGDFMSEVDFRKILKDTAHHFYELGLKAKEENK